MPPPLNILVKQNLIAYPPCHTNMQHFSQYTQSSTHFPPLIANFLQKLMRLWYSAVTYDEECSWYHAQFHGFLLNKKPQKQTAQHV
jgi:hypothetical protein